MYVITCRTTPQSWASAQSKRGPNKGCSGSNVKYQLCSPPKPSLRSLRSSSLKTLISLFLPVQLSNNGSNPCSSHGHHHGASLHSLSPPPKAPRLHHNPPTFRSSSHPRPPSHPSSSLARCQVHFRSGHPVHLDSVPGQQVRHILSSQLLRFQLQ